MNLIGINSATVWWLLAVATGALIAAGVCAAFIRPNQERRDD